jgi:hypothetical protein
MKAENLSVLGCRTTEQGVLVKFSDGQFHLFDTSYLLANRVTNGIRIPSPSEWLDAQWTKSSSVLSAAKRIGAKTPPSDA